MQAWRTFIPGCDVKGCGGRLHSESDPSGSQVSSPAAGADWSVEWPAAGVDVRGCRGRD